MDIVTEKEETVLMLIRSSSNLSLFLHHGIGHFCTTEDMVAFLITHSFNVGELNWYSCVDLYELNDDICLTLNLLHMALIRSCNIVFDFIDLGGRCHVKCYQTIQIME